MKKPRPLDSGVQIAWSDVDQCVEAYEDARCGSPEIDIDRFLPSPSHPDYRRICCELLRVDMEYRWQEGRPLPLLDYEQLFPEVWGDSNCREQIVFEEYRQRCQAGQNPDPRDYAVQYGVSSERWRTSEPISGQLTSAEASEFPPLKSRFLGFELVGELGRGAFGRAYLARQEDLANRYVVLKVTTRLSREPERLALMQHPNIVPVYSVHRQGQLQAMCMPFLGSTTLADLLTTLRQHPTPQSAPELVRTLAISQQTTRRKVLSDLEPATQQELERSPLQPLATITSERDFGHSYVDAVLRMMLQIAHGLAHAHDCGLVHRDMKPANILVTKNGRPMILDFNISAAVSGEGERASAVGGTLPYMAPEHLRAMITGQGVSKQSDLYSLGVIAVELLTGQLPFPPRPAVTDQELESLIEDRGRLPAVLERRDRSLAPGVKSIITKCLAVELPQRYSDAHQLCDDLERQLHDRPLRFAPNTSWAEWAIKWRRRHPRLTSWTAVATALAVTCALLALLWMWRDREMMRVTAQRDLQQFLAAGPTIRAALTVPDIDAPTYEYGRDLALRALERVPVDGDDQNWPAGYRLLDKNQRQRLLQETDEALRILADAADRVAQRSGDPRIRRQYQAQSAQYRNQLTNASGDNHPRVTDDATAQRLAIMDQIRNQDYASAASSLQTLVQQHPGDVSYWFLLGNCLVGLRDLHRAEGCYSTCVALWNQSFLPYYHRGLCRLELADYDGAGEDFTRAIRRRNAYWSCYFNRALARHGAGDTEGAIADLSTVIDGGQFPTRTYFLRARYLDLLGRHELAEQDRAIGLRVIPQDEESWVARGIARLLDDPAGALDDFQHALKLNPNSRSALQNVAYVLSEKLGRPEESIDYFDRLLEQDPNSGELIASRGVIHARLDHRQQAHDDAQRAATLSEEAETWYRVACIYALVPDPQQPEKAWKYLAQALRMSPELGKLAWTDPDVQSLRDDERFRTLIAATGVLLKMERVPP